MSDPVIPSYGTGQVLTATTLNTAFTNETTIVHNETTRAEAAAKVLNALEVSKQTLSTTVNTWGSSPNLPPPNLPQQDNGNGQNNAGTIQLDNKAVIRQQLCGSCHGSSRKESGLGLGLPLVEHIVRLHGGAVTLENRHTGGVRVRVYLPIR